jgi:hypothetical protein
MVGVAGPGPQGGEHSGGGSTGPSTSDFITGANAAQQASGSSDSFRIYQGTSRVPLVNSAGDVRVGTSITKTNVTNSTDYINYLISLQTSNPTLYKQYQKELYQAGYYGNSKPAYGTYTGMDGRAFSNFIQDYGAKNGSLIANNLNEITPEQYLAQTIKLGGGALNAGPAKQPLTINYTDPAALKEVLQSAAQKNLGRDLSPKELAGFISEFHGKEAAAAKANYNNASSATQPEATGEAQSFIDQGFTMEEGQRRGATFVDSLNQMLGVL